MVQHFVLRDTILRKSCLKAQGRQWVFFQQRRNAGSWTSSAQQSRQRRGDIWIPTVNIRSRDEKADATQLLFRAGYLRQAYSGIFHLLPLGLRVQDKLEQLINKHMQSIGASRVSLSSISSQNLWAQSGRLLPGSELFKFRDRKGSTWLLAPTHEEEITSLVRDVVHSPTQLPIRLYQISRKYRDEKRPRGGLLRGREFIMKDLYTFDSTSEQAQATYDLVRKAYRNLFDELAVPYVEARADSGNMGGSLSHEYHFPSPAGEDDIISCELCDYARNEEWVPKCTPTVSDIDNAVHTSLTSNTHGLPVVSDEFTDTSNSVLVKAFAPYKKVDNQTVALNQFAVKAVMANITQLDTGIEEAHAAFLQTTKQDDSHGQVVYYLFDPSIDEAIKESTVSRDQPWLTEHGLLAKVVSLVGNVPPEFSLLKQSTGDACPQCHDGKLRVRKAIEVGHTFHLGTRYSSKLGLTIKQDQNDSSSTAVEMGCHGIGVSRLVAAVASACSDSTGLNWPASIAPFQVVIVVDGSDQDRLAVAERLYDQISLSSGGPYDVLLDDRSKVSNGYKLKDADIIGYPVIVIVGRAFTNGQVEIQCRSRDQKDTVDVDKASAEVSRVLRSLLQ